MHATTMLKNQQILIETIFRHIPQLVFWKDTHSVYLGCNTHYAQLLGLNTPEEIIGQTDDDIGWLPDGDTADQFREGDQETLQGRSVTNQEEWLSLPNGKKLLTLINKVPLLNDDGQILGVLGVATDITEKKKTEQELTNIQGQLQGMKVVSATIAHELRTPLATIKNGLASIQQVLPDLIRTYLMARDQQLAVPVISLARLDLLTEVLEHLPDKVDESNHIMDMLLTNIDSGERKQIPHTRCSAVCCVKEALAQYPFLPGFEHKVTFTSHQDFTFYGQKLLIVHVLLNLLKNALYFIQKMQKGEIQICFECHRNHNEIHFKDTAQGIKSEYLSHIFEPFYTKDTNKGTGIGLAFCQTVMVSCSGSICCESIYGEYCEFILTFPKNPKQLQ